MCPTNIQTCRRPARGLGKASKTAKMLAFLTHRCLLVSSKCCLLDDKRPACLMKQFSSMEITSTFVLPAVLLQIFLESSMLLSHLHFKLHTGAHLLLMEHQLLASCTSNTLLWRCGSLGFRSSDSMSDVDWCHIARTLRSRGERPALPERWALPVPPPPLERTKR